MADPVAVTPLTVAQVDISDLTTGVVGGTGVLDVLLNTQRAHLNDQFNKGRISNTDYANVFIATYNQTLQTALQFLLERNKEALILDGLDKQNRLTEAQIAATNSQRLGTEAQTALTKAQTSSTTQDNAYKEAQTRLTTNQAVQVEIQTKGMAYSNEQERLKVELVGTQLSAALQDLQKFPVEMDILRSQLVKSKFENDELKAQTKLTYAQVAQAQYQIDFYLPAQLVLLNKQIDAQVQEVAAKVAETQAILQQTALKLPAEVAQLTAQTGLINEQTAQIVYEVTYKEPQQLALLTQQVANATAQLGLTKEQIQVEIANAANVAAQTTLYAQKLQTERAEIDNSIVGAGSKMDSENKLLQAQTTGFKQNSLTAAAKLMLDPWMAQVTAGVGGVTANAANKLNDAALGAIVSAMASGVGVTV